MSSHDIWGTPLDFFGVLNSEFNFDLDAAATQQDTLCTNFISPQQDALITPWQGKNVFCNPPYGAGSTGTSNKIENFIQRAYEQHIEQKNTIVLLLPAYSDPKYWANYVMKAHEVRFLKGRLKFRDNTGGNKSWPARFPSVVVIFKYIKGDKYGYAPHQFVWDWRK